MSQKNTKKFLVDISDVWPQERDFIEKPERFKYVRKLIKSDGCVFCNAYNSLPSVKSLLLFKNKHAMVVLNKYPYNNGHILILPTRHTGKLVALKKAEYSAVMTLLKQSAEIIEHSLKTENLNIGLNQGGASGAGIPEHLHWHIIPRWLGDTNFFPLIADTKVHSRSVGQMFKTLRAQFKKLES